MSQAVNFDSTAQNYDFDLIIRNSLPKHANVL